MACRKGQKRKFLSSKVVCAHCKLDSNVFSFGEVVIDDNLFEFEELDAFIEAIQSAETLVTWKSSDWCRLFSIKLGPIVDLWNCIAAESGFVPTPQQWEDSKGLSMAQIINMLWKTNNSSGMLKYVPQNPARVPWESVRIWRGNFHPNNKLVFKKPPAWVDDPCIPDTEDN